MDTLLEAQRAAEEWAECDREDAEFHRNVAIMFSLLSIAENLAELRKALTSLTEDVARMNP